MYVAMCLAQLTKVQIHSQRYGLGRKGRNMIHTEFFSCAPDLKLRSPAGIGKTFESTIGSDIGSVGISWADSRRMALNMATSSLATHCSIT